MAKDRDNIGQRIEERKLQIQQEQVNQAELERRAKLVEQKRLEELQRQAERNPENIEALRMITEAMDDEIIDQILRAVWERSERSRNQIERIYPEVHSYGISDGEIRFNFSSKQYVRGRTDVIHFRWDKVEHGLSIWISNGPMGAGFNSLEDLSTKVEDALAKIDLENQKRSFFSSRVKVGENGLSGLIGHYPRNLD